MCYEKTIDQGPNDVFLSYIKKMHISYKNKSLTIKSVSEIINFRQFKCDKWLDDSNQCKLRYSIR